MDNKQKLTNSLRDQLATVKFYELEKRTGQGPVNKLDAIWQRMVRVPKIEALVGEKRSLHDQQETTPDDLKDTAELLKDDEFIN